MGDPVEKIIDTAEDVVKSDIGKAAAIATAAYFGAPYLAGAEAGAAAGASVVPVGESALAGINFSTVPVATSAAGTAALPGLNLGSAVSLTSVLNTAKDVATVLTPVVSVAGSVEARKAAKAMAAKPISAIGPTATMPSYPRPIVNKAMNAAIEQQVRRRGRNATILTDVAGEKLGA